MDVAHAYLTPAAVENFINGQASDCPLCAVKESVANEESLGFNEQVNTLRKRFNLPLL
jgi:hypothetical protein